MISTIEKIFKREWAVDRVWVPLIFALVILVGHFGLFLGETFFSDEDNVTVFSLHARNSLSNGWRPDLGLGVSFYFGDPGMQHVWGLYRWLHHIFPDPVLAFNFSILFLLWVLSISVYFLLRKAVPELGRGPAVLIALLIPFGSLRQEFIANRHWLPLAFLSGPTALLLFSFLKRPLIKHFFYYTLILFAGFFLGSSRTTAMLIVFSIAFFISYAFYHKRNLYSKELWESLRNCILLNIVSGLVVILLGAWVFYSIFLEMIMTGYIRDANDLSDTFFTPLNSLFIFKWLQGFLQAGWLSEFSATLGISQKVSISGWNNVSPIFPLVLIVLLFHKSKNFWEFCAKFMVVGLLLIQELLVLIPGIMWLLPKALNIFGGFKMHPAIQVYEVVLLGVFIQRLQASNFWRNPLEIRIVRGLAMGLSLFYGLLILLASGSKFIPEKFNLFLQEAFQWIAQRGELGEEKKEFLSTLISENIQILHETMGWIHVIFYGLAFWLVLCFANKNFPGWFARSKGLYFSLLLLITNIFLAWAIYPLNKEPLIWDRQNFTKSSFPIKIRKFDRIARVGAVESCLNPKNLIDCVKSKYLEGEFGPKRYVVGYRLSPGLDFSGVKSFSQKEVSFLVTKFLEMDGLNLKGSFRYLQRTPPFFPYKIYDFTGVKYFVSPYPLPTSENIRLIHSSFQFYLYQNLNTWPYYYLADRIETINDIEELYNAEKGVAYLWEESRKPGFVVNKMKRKNLIELSSFKFDEIEFRSSSNNEEFLVVADAWHPYWRAQIDGNETEILKTNGIFKGVFVPSGSHKIRLFFDNKAYRPGIWISIFSWVLFVCAWISLARRESKIQRAY